MRSTRPKVLHAIAGQSLLAHVLDAVRKAGGTKTAVVVGLGADAVAAEAKRVLPDAEIFVQAERRGTAHAVLAAKAAIARSAGLASSSSRMATSSPPLSTSRP